MEDPEIDKLEHLVKNTKDYLDNFLKLGLEYENREQLEQASRVYKEGILKAKEVQHALSGALLGLLD